MRIDPNDGDRAMTAEIRGRVLKAINMYRKYGDAHTTTEQLVTVLKKSEAVVLDALEYLASAGCVEDATDKPNPLSKSEGVQWRLTKRGRDLLEGWESEPGITII